MQKENSLGVPNLVSRSRPATRLIIIPANPKVRLQLYPKPDSVAFENPSTDTLKIRKINLVRLSPEWLGHHVSGLDRQLTSQRYH